MSAGMRRRDFLFGMGAVAARFLTAETFAFGFCSTGISFPLARSKERGVEDPNALYLGSDRFFMDGGIIEFELGTKDIHLQKYDIIDFMPTVKIFHCQPETGYGIESPIHVIDSVYEFSFIPLSRYRVPRDFGNPNVFHYIVDIIGMFKVFHFNFTIPYTKYLRLNTKYTGYGRISNTCKPWDYNEFLSTDEVRSIKLTGQIQSITNSIPFDWNNLSPRGCGWSDSKYCRIKKNSKENLNVLNPYEGELRTLKCKAAKWRTRKVEVASSADVSLSCQAIYGISIMDELHINRTKLRTKAELLK